MAKASVREISRITGFSPATVSNALNRKRSVSEETAKVILECAQSLGYQQSTQLESIQFVLARKTGAILDESTFHPAVIEGVERQARRHGMSTSFVSLDFSDLDAVRPQVEGLIADPSAAIVLMGTELGEEDYALFANAAAHLIVLDGWSDRQYFDAVVIANTDSVLRAVDYLIEKGHKQIGYLAGDLRIRNFKDRERGYRQPDMARHIGHHARRCLSRHGRMARQRLARRPADGFLCRKRRTRRRRHARAERARHTCPRGCLNHRL